MDKRTQSVIFSSESVEWSTPDDTFATRHAKFNFELDVCATAENAKLPNFISPEMDAFKTPWTIARDCGPGIGVDDPNAPARCWMNPPYCSEEDVCKKPERCKLKRCRDRGYHRTVYQPGTYQWVELAHKWRQQGCLVDMLLPSRTGTDWWHDFIWDQRKKKFRPGVKVEFVPGRLKFGGMAASAPFDSVLVTFLPKLRF
jgi:hypothetical protein